MVPTASSPLISSSSSPPLLLPANPATPPLKSPLLATPSNDNGSVLDFSTKKRPEENPSPILNLSKSANMPNESQFTLTNGPLDLSLGSNKKRELEDSVTTNAHKKPARMAPTSPWTSPLATYQLPYFGAGAALLPLPSPTSGASMKSHAPDPSAAWNGKSKHQSLSAEKSHFGISLAPSDATKALEKMSELSKLGVGEEFRPIMPLPSSVTSGSSGSSGRHSAWQSHWLNKGAEQAKDVLKCVWCKQSFPSLAAMTQHMQEAKHCGVNVPGISPLQPLNPISTPPSQGSTNSSAVSSSSVGGGGNSKSNASDLNLLIKETMPLPRKLVRGQDVWLGKGAEQTRQILKCMWCGQSFRSLAEMTSHMQQTQHYTNIISQEQIISWKSAEESKSGNSSSSSGNQSSSSANVNSSTTNSHVSAVLTCKVCDQAFSSLKELSNHMVKNSHYKEHIMRSITESGGRRRQTREKRKKSLPVRKLLELERAQNELKNGDNMMMTMMMMGGKPGLHSPSSRITCEKCGDKIDMAVFVEHIRLCVGANASLTDDKKNLLKNALMSYNNSVESLPDGSGSGKSLKDTPPPPSPFHQRLSPKVSESVKDNSSKSDSKSSSPSVLNAIEKLIEKSFEPRSRHTVTGYSSSGSQSGSNSSIGSSILKRLGIDESVDYTKPLMDVNMQAAKAYALGSQFHNAHYDASYFGSSSGRQRSGSESSSVSERGSRPESLTPDRKHDIHTPPPNSRATPEKRITSPGGSSSKPMAGDRTPIKEEADVKCEPKDDDGDADGGDDEKAATPIPKVEVKVEPGDTSRSDIEEELVKQERRSSSESLATPKSVPLPSDDPEVGEDLSSWRGCGSSNSSRRDASSPMAPGASNSAAASPACRSIADRASVSPSCTNVSASPTNSERSVTPRSTSDKKSSGSLGALSSMFDSLSGANTSSSEAPAQSNKASSHPLAALQKLCDKTETHHGGASSRSSTAAATNHSAANLAAQSNTPGAILAFSWACNDAVVTDSIMKCAFCDTPFISKGAYRHHLSKMHFVKDGVIPDPVPIKSPNGGTASSSSSSSSQHNSTLPTSLVMKNNSAIVENNCKTGSSMSVSSSCSSIKSPQSQSTFDESPHSKFLKYTELAKQLSSKYV